MRSVSICMYNYSLDSGSQHDAQLKKEIKSIPSLLRAYLRVVVHALGPAARFQMTPQVRTAPGVVPDQNGVDVSAEQNLGYGVKKSKMLPAGLIISWGSKREQ